MLAWKIASIFWSRFICATGARNCFTFISKYRAFEKKGSHGAWPTATLASGAGCAEDVISLVILADLNPDWKPEEYRYERLGCEVTFRFPCCKLLEILPRLEHDDSLPALAAKAQIEALRTSRDPDKRRAARWRLTRKLYKVGWEKREIREAFRLLTWMMRLPKEQCLILRRDMIAYEKENQMSTLLDFEEYIMEEGLKRGLEQGRQKAIIELLELRFGQVPEGVTEAVYGIHDEARLGLLFRTAAVCGDIGVFSEKI